MEITELNEHDLESLAGLYKQFWGEHSSLDKMRATFGRLRKNRNYIFLGAKHDGGLVGSVTGIICEQLYGDCKPFIVLEDVIVDKEHRRKGIGRKLLGEMERRAAERGCVHITLVTERERTDAHRFYQSLGYGLDEHKGFKKRISGAG